MENLVLFFQYHDLPYDVVNEIFEYANYKNRNGKWMRQIESHDPRREMVANIPEMSFGIRFTTIKDFTTSVNTKDGKYRFVITNCRPNWEKIHYRDWPGIYYLVIHKTEPYSTYYYCRK